jgi:hypothetical protein
VWLLYESQGKASQCILPTAPLGSSIHITNRGAVMATPEGINWHLALILDGQIQDIMHTQDRLAAIFLSEPTIVAIEDTDTSPRVGWTYDAKTGEFAPPV